MCFGAALASENLCNPLVLCCCCSFAVFSDGKLEIVVPSFVHYLEVLEGSDGDKLPGIESFIVSFRCLLC